MLFLTVITIPSSLVQSGPRSRDRERHEQTYAYPEAQRQAETRGGLPALWRIPPPIRPAPGGGYTWSDSVARTTIAATWKRSISASGANTISTSRSVTMAVTSIGAAVFSTRAISFCLIFLFTGLGRQVSNLSSGDELASAFRHHLTRRRRKRKWKRRRVTNNE